MGARSRPTGQNGHKTARERFPSHPTLSAFCIGVLALISFLKRNSSPTIHQLTISFPSKGVQPMGLLICTMKVGGRNVSAICIPRLLEVLSTVGVAAPQFNNLSVNRLHFCVNKMAGKTHRRTRHLGLTQNPVNR